MQRVRDLSQSLSTGNLSLIDWRADMVQAIKTAHLEGAAVARGGWPQMQQSHYEWVGQRVQGQLEYLQNFHDQIASGDQPLDGTLANRAEMYVEAGRATHRVAEQLMGEERGHTQERNMLGASQHPCGQCPGLSAQGWVPIGALPPVGTRSCLSRCRCSVMTR